MSQPDVHLEHLQTSGPKLRYLRLGMPETPTIVMLHGLRDTAWSLLPIARTIHQALGMQIVLLEHRGHGASQRSDGYAMSNFLFDVYQLVERCPEPVGIFGHSLGGHLAYRFSALFPELVRATMVVEGLGPPRRPHVGSEAAEIQYYRTLLLQRMPLRKAKPLASLEEAKARLLQGNPRLSSDAADEFIEHLVARTDDGLQWAFDSRGASAFLGASPNEDEKYFKGVQAPTCIVSGSLSYEYWGAEFDPADFSGKFADGEMEARVDQFQNATHHWFENSGHMVHYDEPERLADLASKFFAQHFDL